MQKHVDAACAIPPDGHHDPDGHQEISMAPVAGEMLKVSLWLNPFPLGNPNIYPWLLQFSKIKAKPTQHDVGKAYHPPPMDQASTMLL